jgi:hypothetical protein
MVGDDGEIHHFLVVGAYDDDWTKTPAGWRVTKRVWEHGWISGEYPFAQLPGQFDQPPQLNRSSWCSRSLRANACTIGRTGRVPTRIGAATGPTSR